VIGPIINKNAPANNRVDTLFMTLSAGKSKILHSIPDGLSIQRIPRTEELVVALGICLMWPFLMSGFAGALGNLQIKRELDQLSGIVKL
jgi:hypothetical protein